jgi:site-specific DNA-adenine methylase
MKKTFLFSYFGNKDRECKEIYNFLEKYVNECDTFIEPFGGSFAFIRYLINNKKINKKYIVNDNDNLLIKCYNEYKNEETNEENNKRLLELYEECKNDKTKYKEFVKVKEVPNHILKHVYYNIRPGLFPSANRVVNMTNNINRIKNFTNYKDVTFVCGDGFDLIEKYKDDEKAILFLDPPFLLSCNSYYSDSQIERVIELLKNFNKYKCLILLTLGNHILYTALLEMLKIKVCFITKIKFRGVKETENIYVCNK